MKNGSDWAATGRSVSNTFRLRVACRAGQEAVLPRFFHDPATRAVQEVATQEGGGPGQACVVADIDSQRRDDRAREELMGLLNRPPS